MITFIICLSCLVIGYFFYSKVAEKAFQVDTLRRTPAIESPDGVDKVPLKRWKATLIEFLNIAGTGPIFGAISGALFGPIVFIWIVVGCIFGGAVHDYFSGMISSRNNGDSIAKITGKYIGKIMRIVMTTFSIILLVLVSAVFVTSPSSLLENLTGGKVVALVWMIIILLYYLLASILPIDKILGKAYPVFGIILIVSAILVFASLSIQSGKYPALELIQYFKDFSRENGSLPAWPFMFITVACGAVSGFHATQSPMMAKCITNEKDGKKVFYGAMVLEGIVALIWAYAAMNFYQISDPNGWSSLNAIGGSSTSVYEMSSTLLGPVGSVLAIIGVVICPITSGDTALRSCRLVIAEIFNLDQKPIKNRLLVSIPLFVLVGAICAWCFLAPNNFSVLWRWFAWSNQILACFVLWFSTIYIIRENKSVVASLITALPATFMTAVVITYIFGEPNISLGRFIPMNIAYIIGICTAAFLFLNYIVYLIWKKRKTNTN